MESNINYSDPTQTISSTEICNIANTNVTKEYSIPEKKTIGSRLNQIKSKRFNRKLLSIIDAGGQKDAYVTDDNGTALNVTVLNNETLAKIDMMLDKYDEKQAKMCQSEWANSLDSKLESKTVEINMQKM